MRTNLYNMACVTRFSLLQLCRKISYAFDMCIFPLTACKSHTIVEFTHYERDNAYIQRIK